MMLFFILQNLSLAVATRFFTNSTIPIGLTVSCSNALLADVACELVVRESMTDNLVFDSISTQFLRTKAGQQLVLSLPKGCD
jgi:hypothetical protein